MVASTVPTPSPGSREGTRRSHTEEVRDEDDDGIAFEVEHEDPNVSREERIRALVYEAYNNLPPGWTRNPNFSDGGGSSNGPPYLHEDGRTSWKNPAHERVQEILALAAAAEAEEESSGGEASSEDANANRLSPTRQRSLLKKYRRMLKHGVPKEAVETQARVDGMDSSIIYRTNEDEAIASTVVPKSPSSSSSPDSGSSSWRARRHRAMAGRNVEKYRRMLRSGVPRGAVEQSARLHGCDISELLKNEGEEVGDDGHLGGEEAELSPPSPPPSNLEKYGRMLRSGVPPAAVEQRAKIDGCDITELLTAGGGGDDGAGGGASPPSPVVGAVRKTGDDVSSTAAEPPSSPALFRAVVEEGGRIEFLDDKGPLATLVRKSVLTVRKHQQRGFVGGSGGAGHAGGHNFTVASNDLYDALGILRGVRHARDVYNSTIAVDDVGRMSEAEIRARRTPFLEHLTGIGARPSHKEKEPTKRADIEGLDDLISLVEGLHRDKIGRISDDTASTGMVDFDSLGELYKPGSRVVARHACASGVDALCEVSWSRYETGRSLFGTTRIFKMSLQFVAAVGEHFTVCEFVEQVEGYDGRRSVKGMSFVPLSAYDDGDGSGERMLEGFRARGEMYDRCATGGAHYLEYTKGSFYAKRGGGGPRGGAAGGGGNGTVALRTRGRAMVDTQGAYEAGHSPSVGYDPMVLGIKMKYKEYMLHMRQLKQEQRGGGGGGGGAASSSGGDDNSMVLLERVPEDWLAMTWPAVVGFSFTSKCWGDILVDGLSDIEFNESAYDRLVLPPSRKRMIRALVRHSGESFSDIVSGKGEGSVFLLYGPPGVGKTLTAEAIAEMLRRPLYSVSLGQLGTTPCELETRLTEILDLGAKWDALILLDEADIFLEKRTAGGSLERNAMVSVMLRLVEYFRGVLFLTSNRVDSLDPAFKTRITLALRYDPLDADARGRVWRNLLVASGLGGSVEDGSIDPSSLAAGNELNGREIKNAIRLSIALSAEEGRPVSQGIILETLDVMVDFNDKMNSADAY